MSNLIYSIITPIKESNKGKVYLAKLENYEFPVVIKELKHGNKAVFQALSELNSEYVPQIYRIEESAEGLVVAEEYIEGETLSEHLALGKLTEAEWLDVAKQLCEALHALHAHVPPVIHRDIKPSNIIINSNGRVKLIDFDSSRLHKEDANEDTRLLGTERYAPPEQYGFSQTDCRSDIYSIGVVFDLFSGFTGKERQRSWKRLVEKCTSFSPDSRYQSVEEIEREIKRIEKAGSINKWKISFAIFAGVVIAVLIISGAIFRFAQPGVAIKKPTAESEEFIELNEIKDVVEKREDGTGLQEAGVTEQKKPGTAESGESDDNASEQTTPIAVTEEQYRKIAPEWRDIETDNSRTVALKERIRKQSLSVLYCFKDRLKSEGFLVHSKDLDHKDRELVDVKFTLMTSGNEIVVEEQYVEVKDQLIFINKDYMMTLEEGYYGVHFGIRNEYGGKIENELIVYVAQSDVLQEPEYWLQNTTLSYYGTEGETLHIAVRNDSAKTIAGLVDAKRSVVNPSLYKVLYDGQVLEFSNELLRQYSSKENDFWISATDGTWLNVRINNRSR